MSAIIEKLYSEIQGKEYSYRQLFDVVNERNKQMEYSNILSASQEKGMINRDDLNLDIQFERSNINTYKIVRAGDYVIYLRSFQGGFAFSDKSGVCSPAYTILRPNSFLEYSYLSNYFTSQRFIKSLIIVTYGIRDGRSINVDEWLSMKITIPSKEHQQHIVKMIGSFDRKIESEEAYTIHLSKQNNIYFARCSYKASGEASILYNTKLSQLLFAYGWTLFYGIDNQFHHFCIGDNPTISIFIEFTSLGHNNL